MPWSGSRQTRRRALGLGLHDRPQPPRAAAGCAACAAGSSRAPRRRRRSGAGRTRRCRSAPAARRRSPERSSRVRLGQVAAPVDPVHDLQRAVRVGLEVGDELHELVGLPVEVEPVQRLQRERRVAHPRVAVVPVALAAGRLGQRRRERRDRRAGRHVGQALDRQRRALDRLAPAVVGHAARAPASRARTASSRRAARRPRATSAGRGEALGPRERAVEPLALARAACRARTRLPSMPERHVGAAAGSSGPAPVASATWRSSPTSVHSAGVAAVVEHRLADELDLDAAVDARRPCARACGRRRRRPAAACAA